MGHLLAARFLIPRSDCAFEKLSCRISKFEARGSRFEASWPSGPPLVDTAAPGAENWCVWTPEGVRGTDFERVWGRGAPVGWEAGASAAARRGGPKRNIYDFGFSLFSALGGRFRAPGPSGIDPG